MGWMPSEFWSATLAEVEMAIWGRIDATDRQSSAPAMTEADQRAFYERMQPAHA